MALEIKRRTVFTGLVATFAVTAKPTGLLSIFREQVASLPANPSGLVTASTLPDLEATEVADLPAQLVNLPLELRPAKPITASVGAQPTQAITAYAPATELENPFSSVLEIPTPLAKPAIPKQANKGDILYYNPHTGERNIVTVGTRKGLKTFTRICRDWRRGIIYAMDDELIYLHYKILKKTGGEVIWLNSGYRSSATNRQIGGKKKSFHLKGMATDITIPGVSTRTLGRAARSVCTGGVGTYYGQGFVHIDTRRKRRGDTPARWHA